MTAHTKFPTAASTPPTAPVAVPTHEPVEEAGRLDPLNLLTAQSFSLIAMIMSNDAAKVDPIGRFILDGLNRRARRFLAKIDAELARGICDGPFGTAGRFGENGDAPSIRDIIQQSARQREMAVSGRVG